MVLPRFEYFEPKTITEASALLTKYQNEGACLAGGTDLLVKMDQRISSPSYLVGLKKIPDLDQLDWEYSQNGHLTVGSMISLESIKRSPLFLERFPILSQAVSTIGSLQVRNMATIGGNLCNGSPSASLAPGLMILGAVLKIMGPEGERKENVEDFFPSPFKTTLKKGEILTELEIPSLPSKSLISHIKLPRLTAVDRALVEVAILIITDSNGKICREARIGICALSPTPMRAKKAEEIMKGQELNDALIRKVSEVVIEETSAPTSSEYAREVGKVIVRRATLKAMAMEAGSS